VHVTASSRWKTTVPEHAGRDVTRMAPPFTPTTEGEHPYERPSREMPTPALDTLHLCEVSPQDVGNPLGFECSTHASSPNRPTSTDALTALFTGRDVEEPARLGTRPPPRQLGRVGMHLETDDGHVHTSIRVTGEHLAGRSRRAHCPPTQPAPLSTPISWADHWPGGIDPGAPPATWSNADRMGEGNRQL
jgi:hypothetical protein